MILKNDESLIEVNHGLKLIQKVDGLTFGTDAYLLSAYVRKSRNSVAVDLGSGNGIIPLLLLAKDKISKAYAVEIQEDFTELILRNGECNGFSDRLKAYHGDVRSLEASDFSETVDIVVSNPPYMKCSGKPNESERKNIARHETAGHIFDFCSAASRILKYGGLFYVVWRPDRIGELIYALTSSKLEPKRMTFVYGRANLPPCLLLCEAKKCASPGCFVTAPLIMYNEDNSYTKELADIYDGGVFDELYQKP